MLLKKSLFNTFMMTTMMIVVSACVPKATEKKAVCGVNEAFSTITRSCYSIEEARVKPVGTKSSDTLSEETPKTITLSYTDGNKDQAISCKVSAISSNVEAVSPLLLNGGLGNKGDEVYSILTYLANNIPVPDSAAAIVYRNNMLAALNTMKNSFSQTTVDTAMSTFLSQADAILTLAMNHPSDSVVQNYYTLSQTKLQEFAPFKTQVNNRCECSAGVCTTTISPKLHKSGSAGFSYTITDVDGESASKAVSLTIAAMSTASTHLKPTAKSSYVTGAESNTSTPAAIAFTIPAGGDINSTPTTNFRYYFNGTKNGSNQGVTAKGVVTNCMDLTGSTGLTDTTCTYTPTNGDQYTTSTPAAATVTIDDVVYTAQANGAYGNSISIQYFNLQDDNSLIDPYVTDASIFGLISTYQESFIRVNGNTISVFINYDITSSSKIVDLINNHPQANKMVVATGGSASTFPFPGAVTPSAINLVGGVDAYDNVPFKVNNLISDSSNTAGVQINITSTNDLPMVPKSYNSLFAQNEIFLEEEAGKVVTLSFTDVDSYASAVTINAVVDNTTPTCSTTMTPAGMLTLVAHSKFNVTIPAPAVATCNASGACTTTITVDALTDFSGAACLYYYVTDSSGAVSSYAQHVGISVTGINDKPLLSNTALASSSSLTAVVALADSAIDEDLANASVSYKNIYANASGDVYEAAQLLTVTAVSANTTLLPNVACKNYTPGTATPVGSVIPSATGVYYFDVTNQRCYVSTGSTLATDWKLYPSLTVYPADCNFTGTNYGQGSPVGVKTPSAAGVRYLDTTNNICYKAASTLSTSWAQDPAMTNYKIAYVPATDKSGTSLITVTVKDNGGTTNSGVDTAVDDFTLTVNWVDDPPVFRSFFTSIQTNEGGDVQSDGFTVDEDDGATTDEDAQSVRISSITTDNSSVLPTSAISIFYDLNDNGVEDAGEARAVGAMLEASAANDVSLHKIYLKLDPVDGVSGNANIALTITDGTTPVTKSFSFVVHPIAALHGGWDNISSVGLKTDKSGAPVAATEVQCNYNLSTDTQKCGTNASCTGTSSPHSTIIPTAANVIYWDSSNKKCYRSTSASEYSWVDLKTSCPITRQTGVCSGENCIRSTTPVGALIPTIVGQYVLDSVTNTCYVSTGNTANTEWQVYVPAKVTLAWKSFTVVGSGPESGVQIAGWNVYRREGGADYNFKGGHLKNTSSTTVFTIADPSVRTYTDTTAIAGKVYYYVVRPVENRRNFPTYTPEIYSEVRVLAAPVNYAFVHRWIVNQEICNGMNITTATSPRFVDTSNNFRCQYSGPGSTTISGTDYYDYGRDLLVDSQEAGCPYAPAPACTANGCVGIGTPTYDAGDATHPVPADGLYYDRGTGICYRNTGGTTWQTMQATAITADIASSVNSALNAPLVNVTQAKAVSICSTRPVPTGTGVTFTAANASLPNKKDYMGYASHKLNITDPEITEMEQGFSLNVTSRCNGSSASGLETAYTDSSIPSTSFIYSLPGTASSGIKSIYTGSIAWGSSKGTEACVSRFGIQDLYGNVAEWTTDQMNCASPYVCSAVAGSSYAGYDFDTGTAGTQAYGFDYASGPYNDADGSGDTTGTDAHLTQWTFADQLFNATKFSFPLALPINSDIEDHYATTPALDWILNIGPSSGITTNKLHEDGIIVNGSTGGTKSFAVGGSYLSGNMAGRYTSELILSTASRSDVGLRCIVPIQKADYPGDFKHTYPY